jgi:hypothetical protein
MGKQLTDQQKYDKYAALANVVIGNHSLFWDKPLERQIAINGIRNQLFDSPSTFSGLVSERGQHLKTSELVKEHFYPRQASAYKMFEMLDAGATKDEIVNFIKMSCQVHYVTEEENNALKPFQKLGSGYDTWEEQYAAVVIDGVKGIKLVPYIRKKPGRKPKK